MTMDQNEKKGLGTGAKVAIGCGSGCLILIVLVLIVVGAGAFYVKKLMTQYETELKGYGFEKVQSGQMIDITEPITEPTLLKAQIVTLDADCPVDLAVMAQVCEVNGRIDGKLYFRGQVLMLNAGSEVTGGVDAKAQVVQNAGTVSGGISGEFQLIEGAAPAAP